MRRDQQTPCGIEARINADQGHRKSAAHEAYSERRHAVAEHKQGSKGRATAQELIVPSDMFFISLHRGRLSGRDSFHGVARALFERIVRFH